MRRTTLSVGVLLAMSGITPTYAHHSLSEYDIARRITVNAVVREFRFVNPHPFLLVDARVDDVAQVWRLELDNRFELVEIGMTSNTFARGDRLVVTGPVGHDRKPILYVRELRRTIDGFRYEQPDSTPRIVVGPKRVD
jgi:hypothetical protein